MNLLGSLTDTVLREHFDELTLQRGREYAAGGRILTHRIVTSTPYQLEAAGNAMGSGSRAYSVRLYLEQEPEQLWLDTACSCPMQRNCKHGAALALVLRNGFVRPDGGSRWQASLRGLIEELGAQVDAGGDLVPLALEIALEMPDGRRVRYGAGSTEPRIRMRALRRGAKGGWVKSGVEWREVSTARSTLGHHPFAQLEAVKRLQRSLQGNAPYNWSSYVPTLGDFGDRVLDQLQEAVAAGVELLPAGEISRVTLLDEPLRLVSEVAGGPDGTRLTLGLEHAGRLWSGDRVIPVGHPAHSVGLLDEGVLLLARTARPLTAAVQRLLGQGTVTVPAGEEEALRDLLAPLARVLPVSSPDASVELPEPVPPRLRLTVVWRSSTHAELSWEWAYGERRYALASRDGLPLLRDAAREREILAALPADATRRTVAEGGDALALAIHDLPALRDLDDIDVVEQERPHFRETTDAPEISFDVVAPPQPGNDWLDLAVSITVAGEQVPLTTVLAALTLGEPHLVLPSGLYVTTDRPEFDRLRDVVTAASELRETDGDTVSVGTHDLGVWAQLAEIGIVDEQAAEWVHRAQALRDLVEIPRPAPVGLTTELRHYQLDGFHWLAFLWEHRLGGILADDMGLGKTLQVLALVNHARDRGCDAPFLVVAPTSVVSAWESEAARHAPGLRVRTVTRRTDDVAAIAEDADVVVTTYTLLRLAHESYATRTWAGLVLDEAHLVKNHQSKTYAAVRTLQAPFRLAVTGTPFENRLMELWALLSLTAPGLYPWPRSFSDHVVKPVEKAGDERALHRFRQRIRPFVLRRTKELVAADLPPKQEQVLPVTLSAKHRRLYDTHLAKERQRILGLVDDFARNRVAIFSALTKLRQLALDPALVDSEHDQVGSAKLDLLVEHLSEITAEGHRALVFSQFTSFLRRVAARLEREGITTAYLDGTTRDRGSVITGFRDGEAPVFLISLKAGGVGLTLTEADYVFVLDPWWNPAAEAQAVDRAHRLGQQRPVHVYRLIAEETIEEKVMELKARKAELFAQVVDGDGALGSAIDAEDIRGLFES